MIFAGVQSIRAAAARRVIAGWLLAGCLCGAMGMWSAAAMGAEATVKPMGAWFGLYQVNTFNEEIAWPLDLYADTKYYKLDPNVWSEYSSVLVGAGSGVALTAAQSDACRKWVADGGVLILTGVEGLKMFPKVAPAWTGRKSWRPAACGPLTIRRPGDPLVKGVDLQNLNQMKERLGLSGAEQGTTLIGDGKHALLWRHRRGRGWVVYLGGQLTPLDPKPDSHQDQIVYEMSASGLQLWRNLIVQLQLPRRSALVADWAKKTDAPALTLWHRYEVERPAGAALYCPPFPREKSNDRLSELRFNLGRGDRDWRAVFATATRAIDPMRVTCTDLEGPEGHRIEAKEVHLYAQAPAPLAAVMTDNPPEPGFHKASHYLADLTSLPPLGRAALAMRADEAQTFWVELTCDGRTPPGEYRGRLQFSDASGAALAALPVAVKVWGMRMPAPDLLNYEFEHLFSTLPGGRFYVGKPAPYFRDEALLKRSMQQVEDLGVNVGQDYGRLTSGFANRFVQLRSTGQPLDQWFKQHATDLDPDHLPRLAFTGLEPIYFRPAIEAGLMRFATNIVPPKTFLNAKIGSPRYDRLMTWYWGEFVRYMHERGYRHVMCKVYDELPAKSAPLLVAGAKPLHAAGFEVYTTAYNFMWSPQAVAQAAPYLDLMQTEYILKPWPELAKELLHLKVRADTRCWGTASSSVWGDCIDYPRRVGWAAAYAGLDGVHVHGYLRWKWSDHSGALAGPDRLFNSVSAIAYSKSMKQARYLVALKRLIQQAKGRGIDTSAVEKALAGVIGPDERAIIRIQFVDSQLAKNQGLKAPLPTVDLYKMTSNPARYEQAKVRVLELTEQLRQSMKSRPASLGFGDLALVSNGKTDFELVCPEDAQWVAPLVEAVEERTGVDVAAKPSASDQTKVVLLAGTLEGCPPLKELVDKYLPDQITAVYPARGRYAIEQVKDGGRQYLLIVGGDAQGVTEGARLLPKFFESQEGW
jgi:hypothetical protein